MNVSVVITSSHEPRTIGLALKTILKQDSSRIKEIMVVAPDKETLAAAKKVTTNPKVKLIKDQGKGKPAALNLAFQKASAEILVLTDGDVYLGKNSLTDLLSLFEDPSVGGISGRPISANSRNTLLGFWSHFLTEAAHQTRLSRFNKGQFLELSGYLLAIKKKLVQEIPASTLADDLYLSQLVAKAGEKTAYQPKAEVFVNYPTTLTDWFKQKRRSAYDYWKTDLQSGRSPLEEVIDGLKLGLTCPQNIREFLWLILLFGARLILWLEIFFLRLFGKRSLWQRVETTK
ncbi:MAG: Poly-beta-1,6-N-acetyl-D-glucosamine synthase [Microgenomates group bacterium ADurb.Bin219]|nr:MAG: Poly-beta-1,6-N-acetyl-D-glucosamine synthase [Microgenomates group bacterium ADurb.Bin219]HNP89466.1 glycosyltransferase [Candidatus Woesebacteria bacterium]